MLIKTRTDIPASEITDPEVYRERRRFMQGIAGLGIAGALGIHTTAAQAGYGGKPLHYLPATKYRVSDKLTPYRDVTTYNNFYELGISKSAPSERAYTMKPSPWSVVVEGECAKPGRYDLEDILKRHPLQERIYRFRCVEGWSMVIPWVGFPLADLLKRFEPNSNAKFVEFETLYDPQQFPNEKSRVLDWPYTEGLRMDEAMHPLAIMAVGLYGEVLPNQNGAPMRLMVPWKYGFKNIKSVAKIRFVEEMPDSSWMKENPREYGFYSNVNPQVDHPRWSQKTERRIGEWGRRPTLMFNGYAEQVAHLYQGMDLKKYF